MARNGLAMFAGVTWKERFLLPLFCTSDSTFPSVVDLQHSVFFILGMHSIGLRFTEENYDVEYLDYILNFFEIDLYRLYITGVSSIYRCFFFFSHDEDPRLARCLRVVS